MHRHHRPHIQLRALWITIPLAFALIIVLGFGIHYLATK
jgi:hypothetical protein